MTFFEKISSYDLLTSLIPGAFLLEAFRASGVPLIGPDSLATWLLLSYALGLFCNRIGSLILEGLIRKRIGRSYSYEEYISASIVDAQIGSLVEKATFYRTMLSASVVYLVGIGLYAIIGKYIGSPLFAIPLASITATAVFYLSYIKQEQYISRRVRRCQ